MSDGVVACRGRQSLVEAVASGMERTLRLAGVNLDTGREEFWG